MYLKATGTLKVTVQCLSEGNMYLEKQCVSEGNRWGDPTVEWATIG
jgi:hypothetical protein